MGGPEEQRLSPVGLVRAVGAGVPRFHVTGASGWFGRTAIDLLRKAFPEDPRAGRIIGYASATKSLPVGDGEEMTLLPLDALPTEVNSGDLLLHFAYRTREHAAADDVNYVRNNLAITTSVVAAVEAAPVRGVFMASSGAVYGSGGRLAADLAANPYGTLKHLDELVVRQAVSDAGAGCSIARAFAVSGPFMTKPRSFALGDLIHQVDQGRVVIRATTEVVRAYTAVADIVALGTAAAVTPGSAGCTVFDSGGEPIEIAQLVARIARVLGRTDVVIDRPEPRGAPDRYVSARDDLHGLASQFGLRLADLDEQIGATATYLLAGEGRSHSV